MRDADRRQALGQQTQHRQLAGREPVPGGVVGGEGRGRRAQPAQFAYVAGRADEKGLDAGDEGEVMGAEASVPTHEDHADDLRGLQGLGGVTGLGADGYGQRHGHAHLLRDAEVPARLAVPLRAAPVGADVAHRHREVFAARRVGDQRVVLAHPALDEVADEAAEALRRPPVPAARSATEKVAVSQPTASSRWPVTRCHTDVVSSLSSTAMRRSSMRS